MIFAVGMTIFVLGLAYMMQSPMIGGMVALAGWGILQRFADDESVDRFIGFVFFLGLIGLIVGLFVEPFLR